MYIQSPNYTKGRGGKQISKVIIHWFGIGTIDGAEQSFLNPARQASAHYLISDDRLDQMVDENDTAWHCGVFSINQISVGIEHDANPDKELSKKSYQTSGRLVKEICERHNIPLDREHIIGHNEVKATQCPGTINIDKIIQIAKGEPMAPRTNGPIPAEPTCEAKLTAMTKTMTAYKNKSDDRKQQVLVLEETIDYLNQQIDDLINATPSCLVPQVKEIEHTAGEYFALGFKKLFSK